YYPPPGNLNFKLMLDIPTQYCESLIGNILSQPLNAISNVAYFVAAFIAYRYLRQQKATKLFILPALLGVIGIGSAWWHIANSYVGDMLDTYSIALFASVVTIIFLTKITKSKVVVTAFFVVLLFLVFLAETLAVWNGSLPYVVLLGGFLITGIFYKKKFPSTKLIFLSASLTFLAAITVRSVDIILCPYIPTGTHFLWHILVATLGYQIILLIAHAKQ
ncbi:MAG: ceramidase, partial [bacterium]|nr:ceramidase [bacterium]